MQLNRPIIDVPMNFEASLNDEAQPNDLDSELYRQRRKRYADLLHFYQQLQEKGESNERIRPDLEATKKMQEEKMNFDWKGVGHVPGSIVGDFFFYRTELFVLGLHRAMQAGIAYTEVGQEKIGCSIVASGGYEDDEDHGETMIYTGHGGNNKADRRQVKDQKPEGGNLALLNSLKYKQPVRVIRGHSDIPTSQSPSKKIYSYDGLYQVVDQSLELGASGFKVFKFKLERLPNQRELGSRLVSFVGKLNKAPSIRTGVVIEDLSGGQEPIPVSVVNTVDDTRPPSSFEYTTKLRYPKGVSLRSSTGCSCKGDSCHSVGHRCSCVLKNSGKMLPYNQYGHLIRAVPAVYECGSRCKCSLECHNRVCQKGLRYRLEIFKTEKKGWAVRSWDFIPSGGFVCEYTGVIMDTKTADELDDDDYLFNLDFKQGNEARWGVQRSDVFDSDDSDMPPLKLSSPKYVIDASKFGGVARFVNHSCTPNLFVQCVLYDHGDLDLPHVMLFAGSDISPFQELTYDYGYALNSVYDSHGNLKKKDCHCGTRSCRKRLY